MIRREAASVDAAPATQSADLYLANEAKRRRRGVTWRLVFLAATATSIIALTALLTTIFNSSFGLVAVENAIDPASLARSGVALEQMATEGLIAVLSDHISSGLLRRLEFERPLRQRSRDEVYQLVIERVVDPSVVRSWTLYRSLLQRQAVLREVAAELPTATVEFRAWISFAFVSRPQSSVPEDTGVRASLLGSVWTILITIVFAFPVGVGAAIYLQEYAKDNRFNRLVQTNINNLAGVPSIVYGMLGLAVFVRALEGITSGALFGAASEAGANGRTILSAGLTLGLLILPVIIINSQEAIKAVPDSLRQSSYAVGATKWQTIRGHVLPASLDRILTGTILAVSRAIGETAPMVVIGASTLVTVDPSGPFSKFTTLPIQIYQWTARPQAEFRNAAAAGILVLLTLLLTMNAAAVILRNRVAKRRLGW